MKIIQFIKLGGRATQRQYIKAEAIPFVYFPFLLCNLDIMGVDLGTKVVSGYRSFMEFRSL